MAKSGKIQIDHSYVPKNTDYSHRRVEEVAAKHNILARAADDGRKNEPATSATHLSAVERELVDDSLAFVGGTTRMAGKEITDHCNKIQMLSPTTLDTTLERANIRREVVEVKDRYRDDLELAFQERQQAWSDLRAFEEQNRLPPLSAAYKSDTLMFFSVLLALILGEGVFNAFLFQELQDRGLIGGLVLALAVGLANILMGLGTGFLGWRLMIHVQWLRRLLGIIITVIFMTGALALHPALGDLREAITHDMNAQIDFLVILKPERWFNYSSIPPFVLFAVGVATFLIAALKGRGGTWSIVAPYWNHDVLDRRYRRADAALQDAKANLKDTVQNAFDGERAKLRARYLAERQQVDEIRRLAAEAHGIERTVGDSIEAEIGRLNIGVKKYRDRNQAVRTTPAPAYFESFPSFDEWRATRLDLSKLTALVTTAERMLADNGEKLAALEEKTLQEQVTVIENMVDTITGSERRSAVRLVKDNAKRRPRAA